MDKLEFANLKKDIKEDKISNFYIFHGVEHYMKSFYIDKIQNQIVEGAFKSFNLEKFDELNFNIENFENAIESYPAMSERKLIIIRDVDIFKIKADIKDRFLAAVSDLPDYVCVIFDFVSTEYKPDGRAKLGQIIKKTASVVEFEYLTQNELKKWIMRRFKSFKLEIDNKTLEYLIFTCGMSMSSLANETSKLSGYCEQIVTQADIDLVCTKILDAKIFDVLDNILSGKILKALDIVNELIMLKNDEFSILSVINSQFQRLYIAKLCLNSGKSNQVLSDMIGIRSSYAVNLTINSARKFDIKYLRSCVNLCVKALFDMVSKNIDKAQILELLVVNIGGLNDKN